MKPLYPIKDEPLDPPLSSIKVENESEGDELIQQSVQVDHPPLPSLKLEYDEDAEVANHHSVQIDEAPLSSLKVEHDEEEEAKLSLQSVAVIKKSFRVRVNGRSYTYGKLSMIAKDYANLYAQQCKSSLLLHDHGPPFLIECPICIRLYDRVYSRRLLALLNHIESSHLHDYYRVLKATVFRYEWMLSTMHVAVSQYQRQVYLRKLRSRKKQHKCTSFAVLH